MKAERVLTITVLAMFAIGLGLLVYGALFLGGVVAEMLAPLTTALS